MDTPQDHGFSLRGGHAMAGHRVGVLAHCQFLLYLESVSSLYGSDGLMQDSPDKSGMYDEKSHCAGGCWVMKEYDLHCVRDSEYCFTIFCIRAIVSSYL